MISKKVKHLLKILFHSAGIAAVIGCTSAQFFYFLNILVYGHVILIEANIYILATEIIWSAFGLVYIFWKYFQFLLQASINITKKFYDIKIRYFGMNNKSRYIVVTRLFPKEWEHIRVWQPDIKGDMATIKIERLNKI